MCGRWRAGKPDGEDRRRAPHRRPCPAPDALTRSTQPALSGDGPLLRPWHRQDAPAVLEAFAAADIERWHLRRIDDLHEAQVWVASWATRWQAGTDASWAVTAGPHIPALGCVALREVALIEGTSEISYWVLPGARGNNLAAHAVQALRRAFDEIGSHRLWLTYASTNTRSCAVAVRAGYPAEGTMRKHLRHADGWHDMHLHGRLATDP